MRFPPYPYFFKILFKISKITGQSENRFAIKCWSILYRLYTERSISVYQTYRLYQMPRLYRLYQANVLAVPSVNECTERPGCTRSAGLSENGGCKKAFL